MIILAKINNIRKLFITAILAISVTAYSQTLSVPAASPRQMIEQQFSVSKITVDYGRPGVKNRTIFGELVPYGKVWRAGANSSTKITFGQPVNFGGKSVAMGTYGLFIEPTANNWKIILNKDSQNWGTVYDSKLDVTSVTVPVQRLNDKQEYFEISMEPVNDHAVNLVFKWDKVQTSVPVTADRMDKINRVAEKLQEIKAIQREK